MDPASVWSILKDIKGWLVKVWPKRKPKLAPTVLYMGMRWGPPHHGHQNIAYCADCHSKGRLFPLEILGENEKDITLQCLHSEHKDAPRLVRSRSEFRKMEQPTYNYLEGKGTP